MFVIKLSLILLIHIASAQECVNICEPIPSLSLEPINQITNEIIELEKVKQTMFGLIQYVDLVDLHANFNLYIKYLDELIQIQNLNIDINLFQSYYNNNQNNNRNRICMQCSPEQKESILRLALFSRDSLELYKQYYSSNAQPVNNFLRHIKQLKESVYKLNNLVKQYGNVKVIEDKITKLLIKQITMYDNNINELL